MYGSISDPVPNSYHGSKYGQTLIKVFNVPDAMILLTRVSEGRGNIHGMGIQ
jgi:hypothetical protein